METIQRNQKSFKNFFSIEILALYCTFVSSAFTLPSDLSIFNLEKKELSQIKVRSVLTF